MRIFARAEWLALAVLGFGLLTAAAARAADVVFLSTQLRPIDAAQAFRSQVLAGFPGGVDFVTEQSPQLGVHVRAEAQGASRSPA